MSCNNEKKRIIIKQGSGVPTVPSSSDHTDGTWIATDIYDGEFYQDTDTGIIYNRDGSNIKMADGTPFKKVYRATLSQSGTSAPTEDAVLENTLSGSITWSYLIAGNYLGTLTGEFPNQSKFFALSTGTSPDDVINVTWNNANSFIVSTTNAGSPSNGLLTFTPIQIFVYS